jgi:hypothetical protein
MAAQEQPAMVLILTIGYRAKCVRAGCGNVARAIARMPTPAAGRCARKSDAARIRPRRWAAALDAGLKIHDDRK